MESKLNHSYNQKNNENPTQSRNCKNSLLEGKKMASAFIIGKVEKTGICHKQSLL